MKTKLLICGFCLTLISAVAVSAQRAKTGSIYTSLSEKSCKVLEQSVEDSGSYRAQCAGIAGFKLQVTEGDLRQSIDVIAPNKKRFELDLTGNVSTAFSSVGEKAEWRVTRKGRYSSPTALIIRYNASENPDDPAKMTSYLVIAKITKKAICVTDVVKPSSDANIKARKLADLSAAKPCKVPAN